MAKKKGIRPAREPLRINNQCLTASIKEMVKKRSTNQRPSPTSQSKESKVNISDNWARWRECIWCTTPRAKSKSFISSSATLPRKWRRRSGSKYSFSSGSTWASQSTNLIWPNCTTWARPTSESGCCPKATCKPNFTHALRRLAPWPNSKSALPSTNECRHSTRNLSRWSRSTTSTSSIMPIRNSKRMHLNLSNQNKNLLHSWVATKIKRILGRASEDRLLLCKKNSF